MTASWHPFAEWRRAYESEALPVAGQQLSSASETYLASVVSMTGDCRSGLMVSRLSGAEDPTVRQGRDADRSVQVLAQRSGRGESCPGGYSIDTQIGLLQELAGA